MNTRANSKDHDRSSGARVALPGSANAGAGNRTRMFPIPLPRSHAGKQAHRSAAEEWHPHLTHADRSAEWWNLTAAVRDPADTRYFLSWTVTHPGSRHLGQLPPPVITQITPGMGLYACRLALISYQASIRKEDAPTVFAMNDDEAWDEQASTLCLRDARHEHECAWSFNGERMDLAVRSPALAVHLIMHGGSQVIWADGGHSSSYSLPHLQITGSITYSDERGTPTTVDVSGPGWADRQWGDYLTDQAW